MRREYIFQLSDKSDGDTSKAFYTVMLGFLERLAAHDGELPCASRAVTLQLINANQGAIDEGFSAELFTKALMVMDEIKQKHPTLVLGGLVSGYDSEFCLVRCVKELVFSTPGVEIPEWEDPDDSVLEDSPIDGVFVDRKYVDGENVSHRRLIYDFLASGDEDDGEEDEFVSGDDDEEDDEDDDGSSFVSDEMDDDSDFEQVDSDH